MKKVIKLIIHLFSFIYSTGECNEHFFRTDISKGGKDRFVIHVLIILVFIFIQIDQYIISNPSSPDTCDIIFLCVIVFAPECRQIACIMSLIMLCNQTRL